MKPMLRIFVWAALCAAACPVLADKPTGDSKAKNKADAKVQTKQKGPPPWAPAHGYRAKYTYRYFPGHEVYFEPKRGTYFYLEGGSWRIGVRLPDSIKIDAKQFVELPMDVDKPFEFHADVKASFPAPPSLPPPPELPLPSNDDSGGKGKGKGKNK
jgi:hypothetical protein